MTLDKSNIAKELVLSLLYEKDRKNHLATGVTYTDFCRNLDIYTVASETNDWQFYITLIKQSKLPETFVVTFGPNFSDVGIEKSQSVHVTNT